MRGVMVTVLREETGSSHSSISSQGNLDPSLIGNCIIETLLFCCNYIVDGAFMFETK